jgi:ParB family transcriptional regulator, chromosome partitioning protein
MKKELKFTSISLTEISLPDDRFRISPEIQAGSLLESIRKSGLLAPPVLINRDGKLIILSGWKRIEAARILGYETVHVFLRREAPDHAAFELPVYENLSFREYASIEKAEIIAKFKKFGVDERVIKKKYLTLLALPPKVQVIKDCLKIHTFNPQLKRMIFRENFSFPVLQKLAGFKADARRQLIPVLKGLSRNSRMGILENIMDILERDQSSLTQVFGRLNLSGIITSERLSDPQKSEKIRQLIRKDRYPAVSARHHQCQDALKGLGLPENFIIRTPKNFEDEGFFLQVQCRTLEEFKKNMEGMERLTRANRLAILFDVLNDD